ncbi:hypothetical protein D8Y22_07025 [Salinadaptatus halalkaliphilus]|uniref:Uncharacterized protein n=1 Tax=Salinadaptatus halalkaliphilus TaxID=2419781 RepID=A0A4S3TMS2_9EURY|nr:hypothetical protein [Salinadaptatus halalkaliphilus]THE65559.1 hypothetical protein D8Y22_07025 [Salinadaptatus halalkaliphilus]
MTLIVDRTTAHDHTATERTSPTRNSSEQRYIDVSDLDLEGIEAFVASSLETDHVALEQRGTRTYLCVES